MRWLARWTFCVSVLFANFAAADSRFFAHVGLFTEHLLSVAGQNNGSAGVTGGNYGFLGLGLKTSFPLLGGAWFILPSVSYTATGRTLNDDAGKVNIWSLVVPFGTPVAFFDFKMGPGILYYQYRGYGGQTTLTNDTGSTSVYFPPADSVTAKVMFWDFGLGIDIGSALRFDLDIYINGILSLRRDFNLSTRLAYFF
jgi:hypothetical protein